MEFRDHPRPFGTPAYVDFCAWLAKQLHFYVCFAILDGLEGRTWIPKASQGLQKGTPKWVKIRQKSTPALLGMPRGVRGYPPRCLQATRDAYLCVFMHIFMYIIDIYAYLCIYSAYLCLFRHIYVYFMHIYAYLCKRDAYLCISMHIYTYLCISMHCMFTHTFSYKDVDILLMKKCAAGLHSTGSWSKCKHTQYTFVMHRHRNNQHTFGCCTGITPWHGGGLGAVRL